MSPDGREQSPSVSDWRAGHLGTWLKALGIAYITAFKRRGYTLCWRRGLDTPRPAKSLQAGATAAHLGVLVRGWARTVYSSDSLTMRTSDAPPVCAWSNRAVHALRQCTFRSMTRWAGGCFAWREQAPKTKKFLGIKCVCVFSLMLKRRA